MRKRRLKSKLGKRFFSEDAARRNIQPVFWNGRMFFGVDGVPLIPEESLAKGISLADANKIATEMYTAHKFYMLTKGQEDER